jgi:8-amino-7-oxononanoate synthase
MNWTEWAERERMAIENQGRLRVVRDFDARGPRGTFPNGRQVVSFASNDYLGLTMHPAVIAGGHQALDRWGAGAGSARLIVGSRPVHSELERAVAHWKRTERALLFPNGYAANLGVLTTFGGPGVTVFSDELNHASIVDACRLARAQTMVYPHKDMAALDQMLELTDRNIVVSDSVFSMDGDVALIEDLAELCRKHSTLLVLDEAHAVLGPDPELSGVEAVRVGTMSKFLGAMGGFAATSKPLADLMINRARSFIFTTASSPADAGAALAAIRVLQSAEGRSLEIRLRALVERFKPGHPSPIVPIVVGSEEAALAAASRLLERGYLVPAIRPPSVPVGSSRLRVTLSAAHTDDEVDGLASSLEDVTVAANA